MKHSENSAVISLSKKHDLRIYGNTIKILSNTIETKTGQTICNPGKYFDLGNKSWGKIDYLIKKHGYHINHVDKF